MRPISFVRARELLEERMDEPKVLPVQRRTLEYLKKFSPKEDIDDDEVGSIVLHNLSNAPEKTREYAKTFWEG